MRPFDVLTAAALACAAFGLGTSFARAAPPTVTSAREEPTIRRNVSYASRTDLLDPAHAFMNELDIFLPPAATTPAPGKSRAILLFHGGGFSRGLRTDIERLAIRLAGEGYVVFNANYRLASEASPELGYPFPAAFDDAEAALLWCRAHAAEFSIDPDAIVAMGYSAGATVAAHLGVTKNLGARVGHVEVIGGRMNFTTTPLIGNSRGVFVPSGRFEEASPLYAVDAYVADFGLTYGDAAGNGIGDGVIDLKQGSDFRDRLRASGRRATFRIAKGMDHGALMDWIVGPGFPGLVRDLSDARFLGAPSCVDLFKHAGR